MARRGENIRKRKDGRWEARYITSYDRDGKARYKSIYAKSYSEVKQKLKKIVNTPNNTSCSNSNITVKQVAEEWLSYSTVKIKSSTYDRYTDIVNNHIIGYFGKMKIKKIDNNILNSFIKHLHENGRKDGKGGLSAKTIQDIITVIKQIIKYAVANRYLAGFQLMLLPPKVTKKEIIIFSKEEQEKIESFIIGHLEENISYLGILISFYTGIRLGELCALKWSDISIEEKTLCINKTMQRIKNTDKDAVSKTKIVITTPKSNKSIRTIPLCEVLIKIIKEQKRLSNAYVSTGKCNQYLEPRSYERLFEKLLCECKIDNKNFHTLRHTFATNAIRAGVDIKTLSELLGHSSVKLTLDLYVHSDITEKRKAIEKLTKWGQNWGQEKRKVS